MKKFLSYILALTMCFGMISTVFSAEFTFTDVPESEWYYADVKNAVELGLINGKTETTYCPDDNLTYAEAIKLAACMHQLYKEGQVLIVPGGEPWYQTYVDYCKSVGIIKADYSYDEKATRYGYMEIFANAIPDDALKAINNVPDNSIPDVPSSESYAPAVYKLYRAGILQGSDAEHNCKPYDNIKRSEVAAILTRMMDETKRVRFDMATSESIIKVTVSGTQFTHKTGTITKVGVQAEGGTRPYTYRWQRLIDGEWKNYASGSVLPDGTYDPSFELYDSRIKTPGEEFVMKCVVTDKNGNVGESEVVTITTPNFILEKGLDEFTDMCVGKDVTLSVKVKGGKEPYTYKWYFGEFVIPTKNYHMTPKFGNTPEVTFRMTADYLPASDNVKTSFRCEITDADGNMISSSTGVNDVTPKGMPLTIVQQARRTTKQPTYGYDLEFDIDVYGGKQPYSYEWFYESRYRNNVTQISLNTLPQTQVRRFKSELYINLREETTILGNEIYCVITDAEGNTVTSEKVAVCPDFLMIKLEDKTEIEGVGTEYVGTVISGEVTAGDKIGFCGFFDGKHEYVSFTVERITMFEKNLDKAASGDRVGLRASKIKTYESQEKMKEVIGESEYKTQNLAFKAIPTTLEVTVSSDRYSTTPGKYTHINAYINGGSETYKKLEWFKEVDGEWKSIGSIKSGTWKEKGFLMQYIYYGENEPASYRAKCIVTDSYGNTAESNIVTLVTSDIGFETALEAETDVTVGKTVTFSVKPKGGTAPYTYKWYIHSQKNDNSVSSYEYLENNVNCTGHDTDTVTFEVLARYVTTKGIDGYKITLACQVTDATGAYATATTVLK